MTVPWYVRENTEKWRARQNPYQSTLNRSPAYPTFGSAPVSWGSDSDPVLPMPSAEEMLSQTAIAPEMGQDQWLGFGNIDATPVGERARQEEIHLAWTALAERTFDMPGEDVAGEFSGIWWPGMEAPETLPKDHFQLIRPLLSGAPVSDPDRFQEWWTYGGERMEFVDEATGQSDSVFIRYNPRFSAQQYAALNPQERATFNTLMADAGLLDEGFANLGDFTIDGARAFRSALQMANYYGVSVKEALTRQAKLVDRLDGGGRGGGGGGRGPTVKVEVPDYETLLVDAEDAIRTAVGRDVRDYELAIVADHMQERYGEWAEAKKRAMIGGNGTYEVPDPTKLSRKYVADRYEAEIDRLGDVADARETNRLMLTAATQGAAMIGSTQ